MIQAFGGGAMVPVGMVLIGDLYPLGEYAKPMGVIAAMDTAGWAVGHYCGSVVTYHLEWKTIFWLNLPICLLVFILIAVALRGVSERRVNKRMDWLGADLITLSLAALNVGLGANTETGGEFGLGRQVVWPHYAVPVIECGVVFMGLLLWRQACAEYTLVTLQLFRCRNFSAASLANFLVGYSLFVAIANVPLFINTLVADTLDQSALDSGVILLVLTVPMALTAFPGGWLTTRRGYRYPAIIVLFLVVIGFGLMNQWQVDARYPTMVPHLFITGIGFGLTMAPIAAAVVNTAPAEYRGTASALVIIFRLLGMIFGVSSITTYGLHRTDVLSSRLLGAMPDLAEVARVGMQVAAKVIAGAACALAVIPILYLERSCLERSS